ncbi:Molecular chaperone DnaJ [Oceanicaulis sp. 350]|nr:Molecular chaperone DnaJ [Oceanicaulis sp. 350]
MAPGWRRSCRSEAERTDVTRPGAARCSPDLQETAITTAMMTDPYAILGVSRTASADEIRRAYRKLAKALHPDARPNDKVSEDKFKQVTQAFKLLSDPEQRARFDQGEIDAVGQERPAYHFRSRPGGAPGERGPSGRFEDLGDMFSDLFTDFGASRSRGQPMRGAEIKARLNVSFEDAMRGAKKRVTLSNGKSLEVGVPAGVESGKVLRLRGQGHPGRDGGPAGDALIEIVIQEHPWFRREGDNIRLDLPISLKEALFGGAVRAPTIDGMVEVRVPAGANSGAQLRLRGKGAPKGEGERGDQIIRLVIDVPLNDPDLEAFIEDWTPPTDYHPRKRFRS